MMKYLYKFLVLVIFILLIADIFFAYKILHGAKDLLLKVMFCCISLMIFGLLYLYVFKRPGE